LQLITDDLGSAFLLTFTRGAPHFSSNIDYDGSLNPLIKLETGQHQALVPLRIRQSLARQGRKRGELFGNIVQHLHAALLARLIVIKLEQLKHSYRVVHLREGHPLSLFVSLFILSLGAAGQGESARSVTSLTATRKKTLHGREQPQCRRGNYEQSFTRIFFRRG
jgi:hypothetical protein